MQVRPRIIKLDQFKSPSHLKHPSTGQDLPCVVCGKSIRSPRYQVHLVDGGSSLCHVEDSYDDAPADLGWYPVGAECRRKLPAGYIVDTKV